MHAEANKFTHFYDSIETCEISSVHIRPFEINDP